MSEQTDEQIVANLRAKYKALLKARAAKRGAIVREKKAWGDWQDVVDLARYRNIDTYHAIEGIE